MQAVNIAIKKYHKTYGGSVKLEFKHCALEDRHLSPLINSIKKDRLWYLGVPNNQIEDDDEKASLLNKVTLKDKKLLKAIGGPFQREDFAMHYDFTNNLLTKKAKRKLSKKPKHILSHVDL